MEKKFNLKYASGMVSFFAMFASMFSFVSVYLLNKGYDNATIGTVLSITGIVSIILQTFQASFLDKRPDFRLQDAVSLNVLIVLIGSIILLFVPTSLPLLLLIVLIFAFTQSSETLLNSLAFVFEKLGVHINYGFGRGMGSLSFAVFTMVMGYIVEATTPNLIPVFYIVFASSLLFAVRSYKHPQENKQSESETVDEDEGSEAMDQSLITFLKKYKRLVLLMVGVVALLFTHTVVNNFFIQIIAPIGGNSASMGTAVFLGAIVELPAMFNYERIENRIPARHLLKITGLFFLVKHVLTFLAPNMTVIYIAQLFQIGAFALIYPTSVSYIRSVVSPKDSIKGQSLFTSAMAASSVIGSFLGGVLLDNLGVAQTLLFGIVTTVIGLIIVFIATEGRVKKQAVQVK